MRRECSRTRCKVIYNMQNTADNQYSQSFWTLILNIVKKSITVARSSACLFIIIFIQYSSLQILVLPIAQVVGILILQVGESEP